MRGRGIGRGKGFENKKVNPANNRNRREDTSNDNEENLGKKLEEKLALAMEVTDSELTTGRQNKVDNPPMVIMATWQHTKCNGCKKPLFPQDKEYPHNMVLRRTGVFGFVSPKTQTYMESHPNIHFHLNKCLQKNDATMEIRHLTTNDEDFCKMDRANMEFLHSLGFLRPIAEKKMK